MTSAGFPAREVVEVEGHIIDSLTLAKVLDVIDNAGGDYRILDMELAAPERIPAGPASRWAHPIRSP